MGSQKTNATPDPIASARQRGGDASPPRIPATVAGSGRLDGKVALLTGGYSGIGRAVAVLFAREAADVVVVHLEEHDDARATAEAVRGEGQECLTIAGDIGSEELCGAAPGANSHRCSSTLTFSPMSGCRPVTLAFATSHR